MWTQKCWTIRFALLERSCRVREWIRRLGPCGKWDWKEFPKVGRVAFIMSLGKRLLDAITLQTPEPARRNSSWLSTGTSVNFLCTLFCCASPDTILWQEAQRRQSMPQLERKRNYSRRLCKIQREVSSRWKSGKLKEEHRNKERPYFCRSRKYLQLVLQN